MRVLHPNLRCQTKMSGSGPAPESGAGQQGHRKMSLLNQHQGLRHVSDMLPAVAVAGEEDRAGEGLAGLKKAGGVLPAVAAVASRQQGDVVQLRQHVHREGSPYQLGIIHGKAGVVAVTDDLYLWMAHGPDVGSGILGNGAGDIDGPMHADDTVIQFLQNIVGDVQIPLGIQNICFRTVSQRDAEAVPFAQEKAAEIGEAGASCAGGTVVADPQRFHAAPFRLSGQIGDAVPCSVPAGAGVGVEVCFLIGILRDFHGSVHFLRLFLVPFSEISFCEMLCFSLYKYAMKTEQSQGHLPL